MRALVNQLITGIRFYFDFLLSLLQNVLSKSFVAGNSEIKPWVLRDGERKLLILKWLLVCSLSHVLGSLGLVHDGKPNPSCGFRAGHVVATASGGHSA